MFFLIETERKQKALALCMLSYRSITHRCLVPPWSFFCLLSCGRHQCSLRITTDRLLLLISFQGSPVRFHQHHHEAAPHVLPCMEPMTSKGLTTRAEVALRSRPTTRHHIDLLEPMKTKLEALGRVRPRHVHGRRITRSSGTRLVIRRNKNAQYLYCGRCEYLWNSDVEDGGHGPIYLPTLLRYSRPVMFGP